MSTMSLLLKEKYISALTGMFFSCNNNNNYNYYFMPLDVKDPGLKIKFIINIIIIFCTLGSEDPEG